jgi:aminopeptidase YwaD
VNLCTGIEELTLGEIRIYPNPNDGLVNLVFTNLNTDNCLVDILSVDGRLVYSEKVVLSATSTTRQLNLSNLANGIYYCRMNYAGTSVIRKLIIQK